MSKVANVWCSGLIALFLAFSIEAGESQLLPCAAMEAADPDQLELTARLLRNLTLDDAPDRKGGWPIVRILVQPDMGQGPEWAVSLYLPDTGDAVLELVQARAEIWSANSVWKRAGRGTYESRVRKRPKVVEIDRHVVSLPRDSAVQLQQLMLLSRERIQVDDRLRIVIHGTQYNFLSWKQGYGLLCSRADSPDEDSLAGRWAHLAVSLAEVARNSTEPKGVRFVQILEELESLSARPGQ